MDDLSPAARKILISYWVYPYPNPTDDQRVAAVLRAAVKNTQTAEGILAIADELDPHGPPPISFPARPGDWLHLA